MYSQNLALIENEKCMDPYRFMGQVSVTRYDNGPISGLFSFKTFLQNKSWRIKLGSLDHGDH